MKILKGIFIFLITFLFVPFVNGSEDISFNEDTFSNYFNNKGYEISIIENYEVLIGDESVYATLYIAYNRENNYEIDLFKFSSEDIAHKYFLYVIDNNKEFFSQTKIFNKDKKKDVNYSYVRTVLSDLYYFYMIECDNYMIKNNIKIADHDIVDQIYDDFGFIEFKQTDNTIIFVVLGISFVLILIFFLFIMKRRKNVKKMGFLRSNGNKND